MYTTPGHPVAIGTPFFLKTFSEERRRELEVVAGQMDWRVMHEGIGCASRTAIRCLLLVRHPVDRFISYYLERSDRHFERNLAGNRSIEDWTKAELQKYLQSVSRSRMSFTGAETGLFCNKENLLCLDRLRTASYPLMKKIRAQAANERLYFRYLGGPQDRLAWLLDPESGNQRVAVWRMRKCVVGLQAEDFDGYREVVGWHFPWLHEVHEPGAEGQEGNRSSTAVLGRVNPQSRTVRKRLPQHLRDLIAEFNSRDMYIYRAAKRQFKEELRRIRKASGGKPRWPPKVYMSEQDVQDAAARELRHSQTYQIHDSLNRYMQGL